MSIRPYTDLAHNPYGLVEAKLKDLYALLQNILDMKDEIETVAARDEGILSLSNEIEHIDLIVPHINSIIQASGSAITFTGTTVNAVVGQTLFEMPQSMVNENSVIVWVNGEKQSPILDFSTDGNNLNFVSGLNDQDKVEVVFFNGVSLEKVELLKIASDENAEKSRKWAEEDTDVQVDSVNYPGEFSSKHYNNKIKEIYNNAANYLSQVQVARDAAFNSANVYADEATGRAAVVDGGQFSVVIGDDLVRYERVNAGASNEVARTKTSEGVEKLIGNLAEARDAVMSLILDEDNEVFARGDHTIGGSAINAALRGWRAPFKHDGSEFDALQFTVKATTANTRALIKVLDDSFTELARGYVDVDTSLAVRTVHLTHLVRELAVDDIGYISYEPDGAGVLSYPSGNGGVNPYPAGDVDPAVYREYYLASSDVWNVADPAGNYCIYFRTLKLHESTNLGEIKALNDSIAALQSIVAGGSSVIYELPGHTGYDTTYSGNGLGVYVPAQASQYSFNQVTVYGGVNGEGRLRGYIVDPATSNTHIPSSDADTLLFEKTINWSSAVAERIEKLDGLKTVPTGKELHVLWVGNSGSVTVAQWSSDPSGDLLPFRLCLTGVGDEEGIWDETWYEANYPAFSTVPAKLELVSSSAGGSTTTEDAEPFFTIPNLINAVVGTELNLYYDGIVSAHSQGLSGFSRHSCTITGPKGRNFERQFSFTPVAEDVGTHGMTARIWTAAGELVATRNFDIVVRAVARPGTPKNVLMIGDSLTAPGTMTQTAYDKYGAVSGGVAPSFVGSQGASPANHEGYGGKTFAWFAGNGGLSYRVTVSGVGSAVVDAVYQVGGVNYTVEEVNITGGAGTILLSGASAPATSGTLVKQSGSGDASIVYSAMVIEEGNPLYNNATSQVDIGNYRTEQGINGVIDAAIMQLGINDMGLWGGDKTDAQITAIIDYAKIVIDALIADNASCKVIIALPSLSGNTSGGFAYNYGAVSSREVYEAGMFRLRKAMLDAFDAGAYHANVVLGGAGLAIDRFYGYALTDAQSASRITETIKRHTNAVHPATVGYQQMGDQHFADLISVL